MQIGSFGINWGVVRTIVIGAMVSSLCLWAELLPVRTYTTAEGLPANQVSRIVIDSRGFVWFLTPEGLARFDGYRITRFGAPEGLPGRSAQALLETRSGEYFVGTERGLSQFRVGLGKKQFATYAVGNSPRESNVTALLESSDGRIWCATWGALFEVLPGPKFRKQALPEPQPGLTGIDITDMAEDGCGKVWLATVSGVYAMARDGAVRRIGKADGLPDEYVNTVLADKDRRLWAGTRRGLARLRDGCEAGGPGVERVYADVVDNVMAIAPGADGAVWTGTDDGLFRVSATGSAQLQHLTRAEGLSDRTIFSLATDRAGNIWAGSEGAGAMAIEPSGFTTFHEQDGLASDRVWSVLGDRAGNVLAVAHTADRSAFSLSLFDGAKFHPMEAPKVFRNYRNSHTWGSNRILLQSRAGEWWAATTGGLCRYAAVKAESLANRAPEECFEPDATIFQIFEDSKGGIWASAQTPGGDRLIRWDPATSMATRVSELPTRDGLVKSFAEDRHGNIWLGLWGTGGLYRYNGQRFDLMVPRDFSEPATIFSLLADSKGRLWIGADYGLGLVENPGAEKFQMRRFDAADGLSNNSVRAVLEDRAGYIYAATGAGVDRLNPPTGSIKHYSAADGVARGEIESAFRDRDGNLWFASAQGLSRLIPAASHPAVKPSVLITGLQAGGAPLAVSQRGEKSISGIELQPSRNQLQVEFVAFGAEPEANLRYAYKLEGGHADWSSPQGQHVVNFAALAAGEYHFLVKAVNSDGLESAAPAEVDFTVLPPLWRRWWFESLALAAMIGTVYLLHRYRVSQLVRLERMRTAIATDLHDDIGASLSQIAILSEVARAGVSSQDRLPHESLERVGALAREMVDSLSDIVWSIRAEPEGLDSLVRRMREFALDVLVSQGIDFDFRTPPAGGRVQLSLHARRQIFLMFKECIHNVSRHSGCTAVKANLDIADGEIALTVEDNGRGMNGAAKRTGTGGNGIPGMRRRAESLGGGIEFGSLTGTGCRVSIRLPLRRVA